MVYTPSQINAIVIGVRTASTLSMIGSVFILTTFLSSKRFRKPINRLVFYAALGNSINCVFHMTCRDGIAVGTYSALCQIQAFLIQMLSAADVLWTSAMAINVYLSVFKHYDEYDLRRLEWKYICICYGVPFVIALTLCFVQFGGRGKIYGDARLWCWISPSYNFLRISCFYAPVWLLILFNCTTYICVGNKIFRLRSRLRSFREISPILPQDPQNGFSNIHNKATTSFTSRSLDSISNEESVISVPSNTVYNINSSNNAYAITIKRDSCPSPIRPPPHSLHNAHIKLPSKSLPNAKDMTNRALVGYTKCAVLFFGAMLITWVPPSVFRVFLWTHPDVDAFPLSLVSGVVVPLQGFWNAVIYCTSSVPACQNLWKQVSSCVRKTEREGTLKRHFGWLTGTNDRGWVRSNVSSVVELYQTV